MLVVRSVLTTVSRVWVSGITLGYVSVVGSVVQVWVLSAGLEMEMCFTRVSTNTIIGVIEMFGSISVGSCQVWNISTVKPGCLNRQSLNIVETSPKQKLRL